MKYTEMMEKSVEELNALLKEKKVKQFELKLKLKTMQLTDSSEINKNRKEIARILTALTAKKES